MSAPRSPLMAWLGEPAVALLARSWRIVPHGEHHWTTLRESRRPFVFLLWHEVLLPLLWQHRAQQIGIVVSEAKEGRYLAAFAERIGYRLLPGSSTRGGARALLGAIRLLEQGVPVAFTPDGPRGPRRELKIGALRAAQRAGTPVLPLHARARPAAHLRSWDRFVIPVPFSRVDVAYGAPFGVGEGPEGLAAGLSRASDALNALERELPG